MDIINEVKKIKEKIPDFLEMQRGEKNRGYFKYSMTGDLFGENKHWNVGSSAYAIKLAYIVGIANEEEIVAAAINNILSFQRNSGYIFDDMINCKIGRKFLIQQVRKGKLFKLTDDSYIRAESRQCFSALLLYHIIPDKIPQREVIDISEMDDFLNRFDWRYPWHAGSHFSHMLFFQQLAYQKGLITKENYIQNICFAKKWIMNIQNNQTGGWYIGDVSAQQVINGAMKVLSGFQITNELQIDEESGKKLIDVCLSNINNNQACDNFNIVYVLQCASKVCKDYRINEINEFMENRFKVYMEYYFPEYGGFSFYKNRSNNNYYGCKITRGLNEPDMHGTALFMWGISAICETLGISQELGIKHIML